MAIRTSLHSKDYKAFLRVLRRVREEAGITQVELAERLRQTQTYVSKCERGQRRVDVVEFRGFCKQLNVSIDDFMSKLDAEIGSGRS